MAVHASFFPLIRYLLEMGANPAAKDALALIVAIPYTEEGSRAHARRVAAEIFFEEKLIPDRMWCRIKWSGFSHVSWTTPCLDILNHYSSMHNPLLFSLFKQHDTSGPIMNRWKGNDTKSEVG
ncbi:hypothetical protein BDZ89DRAFT_246337 [Hymenopellis radicata]|nr:hypothetical protein BDZ89DRAFT_246337 [Hymenopellis radicata]